MTGINPDTLNKSEYSNEEFAKRKAIVDFRLEKCQKALDAYRHATNVAESSKRSLSAARGNVTKKLKKLQASEAYMAYLEAKSRESEAERYYRNAQASTAYDIYEGAQLHLEEAEQSFNGYRTVYEVVNNPISWSEILRQQLIDTTRNRDQVRKEVESWSLLSRVLVGVIIFFLVVLIAAFGLFFASIIPITGPGLSGLFTAITIAARNLCFLQYNDAKKRLDRYNDKAEDLQRELLGLQKQRSQPSTEKAGSYSETPDDTTANPVDSQASNTATS